MNKRIMLASVSLLFSASICAQDLKIQGVVDGDLSGGLPKMIDVFVRADVTDLSIYGLESANNGGASGGSPEFTFPAVTASEGDHIYVTSDQTSFTAYFGFAADYVNGFANVNGDDAILLYQNGTAVDVYGVVGTNGDNEPWDYTDSFAERNANELPTTTFDPSDWTFQGRGALDTASCGTAGTTNDTCSLTYSVGMDALPVELQSFSVE